jgi:hypothetical protein
LVQPLIKYFLSFRSDFLHEFVGLRVWEAFSGQRLLLLPEPPSSAARGALPIFLPFFRLETRRDASNGTTSFFSSSYRNNRPSGS